MWHWKCCTLCNVAPWRLENSWTQNRIYDEVLDAAASVIFCRSPSVKIIQHHSTSPRFERHFLSMFFIRWFEPSYFSLETGGGLPQTALHQRLTAMKGLACSGFLSTRPLRKPFCKPILALSVSSTCVPREWSGVWEGSCRGQRFISWPGISFANGVVMLKTLGELQVVEHTSFDEAAWQLPNKLTTTSQPNERFREYFERFWEINLRTLGEYFLWVLFRNV